MSYWQDTNCPSIARVNPTIGDISGGDVVTISGELFIQSNNLRIVFGDTEATNVIIFNATHVGI